MQQSRNQQRPSKQKLPVKQRLRLSKKLATYSATVGSLCLAPQLCPADVTPYTPPGGPQTIGQFDTLGYSVDMDGDNQEDFFLIWGIYFGGSNFFEITGGESNIVDAPSGIVDMIPPGGTIPGDFNTTVSGNFSGFVGQRGYVAVKFGIAPNPNTAMHYGYLDVEVNAGNDQLTIYGGAWESTPEASITTPAGVPEPGSLAALAFGGLVAASRRRRKNASCG